MGSFLEGEKKILGVQAEFEAVRIVQIQKGSECWSGRIKISQNHIWVLYKACSIIQVSCITFKPILHPEQSVPLQVHRYVVL